MRNAGFARRLGAMLYDGLLVVAIWLIATLVYLLLRGGPAPSGDPWLRTLLAVLTWLFFAGFWARYGRTLGMQAWRLEIHASNGGRPDFAACTLRFVAALLSWLPLGLGFLWQLWDAEGLAWHDRLSGTRLVVRPAG